MSATPTLEQLRVEYARLLKRDEPLDSRMRELYRLKQHHLKTEPGVLLLLEAVDTTDSVLLQHEMAYNVGQSGCEAAVPGLSRIVRDRDQYDIVTRHEAAESLGALGFASAVPVLREFASAAHEPEVAVRESCELALERIALKQRAGEAAVSSPADCDFVSVDPSPAFNAHNTAAVAESASSSSSSSSSVPTSVEELTAMLLDTTGATSLFKRYMAMFTLRNIGSEAAVQALTRALREDTASALFRHEVAFVLGQLERASSQPALIAALRDESEAAMVRHEAAEALGAIADPQTLPVLQEYAAHPEPLVRDSCVVALEMHKYWAQYNNSSNSAAGTRADGATAVTAA